MKRTLLFIFALFTSIGLSAQMVSITMNVDMNQYTVDPGGVWIGVSLDRTGRVKGRDGAGMESGDRNESG